MHMYTNGYFWIYILIDTTYYHSVDIFFCFNLKKKVKRRVLWKGLYAFFGFESSSVSKKFSLNWSQK